MERPEYSMRRVFEENQSGLHHDASFTSSLLKIYEQTDEDVFFKEFVHYLKYSLIVMKREPAVEWTLTFASKFATKFNKKKEGEAAGDKSIDDSQTEDEDELNPFLKRLFSFLLDSHAAESDAVRFRCCQMVNKLLYNMQGEAQIDDTLYDKIYNCMLQRLRDIIPAVRVQAVFALSRLQDPTDNDCPIIEAFLFLLGYDDSAEVRRSVLSNIAPSKKTLAAILERTRDEKDAVRKLAYQVLANKVHIRALTIAQRVRLLQSGLNDRSDTVRESCVTNLLQAWLRLFEGNILDLLKCLDVESSLETCQNMLKCLFAKVEPSELVANFSLLNEELVVPVEELSTDSVVYWRMLCEHLKNHESAGEEYLDKILPNATAMCNYFTGLFDLMKAEEDIEAQLRNEFILDQLLILAGSLDLTDEFGRRKMATLMQDMLTDEKVGHSLVKSILARYSDLYKDPNVRIVNLVEIISDIREPITTIEASMTAEEQRKMDLQLAAVRVELNELREELEKSISAQDFTRANDIKQRVGELDATKARLLSDITTTQTQEVRTEKSDPETLLKCLTITAEMLQNVNFKTPLPSLQTLTEVLVLPGISSADPAVRNMAVRSLGLLCIMNKETAKSHLLLFLQILQMDQEEVRISAVQVIFDLLLTFGLDAFEVDESEANKTLTEEGDADTSSPFDDSTQEELDDSNLSDFGASASMMAQRQRRKEAEEPPLAHTAACLLTILNKLLDGDAADLRTAVAEGLAKLLLSGRVVSSKILSRLLLLWFNPLTEDDARLRHCLATFFPVYAFSSAAMQQVMEEAVLPTLRILFNAPASSPLAEVDLNNVGELLVQFTNTQHLGCYLQKNSAPPPPADSCCHETLAINISNEILGNPNSFNIKPLLKMINMLDLNNATLIGLKDMQVLCERMLKEVKDGQCVRSLEKFQRNVKELIRSKGGDGASSEDEMSTNEAEPTSVPSPTSTVQTEDNSQASSQAVESTPDLTQHSPPVPEAQPTDDGSAGKESEQAEADTASPDKTADSAPRKGRRPPQTEVTTPSKVAKRDLLDIADSEQGSVDDDESQEEKQDKSEDKEADDADQSELTVIPESPMVAESSRSGRSASQSTVQSSQSSTRSSRSSAKQPAAKEAQPSRTRRGQAKKQVPEVKEEDEEDFESATTKTRKRRGQAAAKKEEPSKTAAKPGRSKKVKELVSDSDADSELFASPVRRSGRTRAGQPDSMNVSKAMSELGLGTDSQESGNTEEDVSPPPKTRKRATRATRKK